VLGEKRSGVSFPPPPSLCTAYIRRRTGNAEAPCSKPCWAGGQAARLFSFPLSPLRLDGDFMLHGRSMPVNTVFVVCSFSPCSRQQTRTGATSLP